MAAGRARLPTILASAGTFRKEDHMSSPHHKAQVALLAAILFTISTSALAGTATFGRGQTGQYAIDKIDMVGISFSIWSLGVYGGGGNTEDCRIADDGIDSGYFVLIGFGDLFDLIPPTSGGNAIVIDDATLELILDNVDSSAAMTVSRVLTDWLVGTPGTNQNNVNQDGCDNAGSVEWASDPDGTVAIQGGSGSGAA